MAIEEICAKLDAENFDAYKLAAHTRFLSGWNLKENFKKLDSRRCSHSLKKKLIFEWVKYWNSAGQSLEEADFKLLSKFIFAFVSQIELLQQKGFLIPINLIDTQFYPKFCVCWNELNEHDIDVRNGVTCFYQSEKLVHIYPQLGDAVCDQNLRKHALQLSSVLIRHGEYSGKPSQNFSNFILACGYMVQQRITFTISFAQSKQLTTEFIKAIPQDRKPRQAIANYLLACGHLARQGTGFKINPKQFKKLTDKFIEVIERPGRPNQEIANFMWGITLYAYIHNEKILEGGYLNECLSKPIHL